jgi:hypothetical protein
MKNKKNINVSAMLANLMSQMGQGDISENLDFTRTKSKQIILHGGKLEMTYITGETRNDLYYKGIKHYYPYF